MASFTQSKGKVLEIKTVQIAPFRTLKTALKDILLETNITFSPDGIRIINMDKSHTILAHLFLDAEKFEYYYCKFPKIIIGVNMFHLFKLINSIDNDDTLTIYIEENEYSEGVVDYLGLKFENGDIKTSAKVIKEIAKALDYDVDKLLARADNINNTFVNPNFEKTFWFGFKTMFLNLFLILILMYFYISNLTDFS